MHLVKDEGPPEDEGPQAMQDDKTDVHKHADHVAGLAHVDQSWRNRQNVLLTIVVGGLFLLVTWSINISMSALEAATEQHTEFVSKSSFSNHLELHSAQQQEMTRYVAARLELIAAQFDNKLSALPRPPSGTQKEIDRNADHIRDLEIEMTRFLTLFPTYKVDGRGQ